MIETTLLGQWDISPYPLYISGELTEQAEAKLASWGFTRDDHWEIAVPQEQGTALVSVVTGQSIILVKGFAFIVINGTLDLM